MKKLIFCLALSLLLVLPMLSAGWYCDNINIFCDKNNMNHLGNNPESINTEKINWGLLKKSINESCFNYDYIGEDTTYQNGELCFQTSLPSDFYYTEQEDGSVKFGWQILTDGVPPGQLKKPITITASEDLTKLKYLTIDWSDFDTAGLDYSIEGNIVTINNADDVGYWLDPTIIQGGTDAAALNYENERKIIQTSNGTIYVIYVESVSLYLYKSSDGSTWSNVGGSPFVSGAEYPSMIIDSNDILHIVYSTTGTSSDIYYVQWNTTSDNQIGSSYAISPGGSSSEGERPDLSLRNDGLLSVVYMSEYAGTNNWGIIEHNCNITSSDCTSGGWSSEYEIAYYSTMGNHAQYSPDITTNGAEFFLVWQGMNATYSTNYQAFYRYTLGGTWQTREVINGNDSTEKIGPPNIIVKENIPMVISHDQGCIGPSCIEFNKRVAGIWSSDKLIYNDTLAQQYPSISTDGTNLHAIWSRQTSSGYCLGYSNSTNDGDTWTSPICYAGSNNTASGIFGPGLSYQYPYSNNGDWYVDAVWINDSGSQYDLLWERIASGSPTPETPIILNNPLNNTGHFINTNITFNCTANAQIGNVSNVTLYINGIANETINNPGITSYTLTKNISFPDVDNYNWTCSGWDTNNTSLNTSTYTFYTSDTLIVNSVTFDTPVVSTTSQYFTLNVTWDSITYPNLNAQLVYNGTPYGSIVTPEGSNGAIITNTIGIPSVIIDTNFTFFWNLTISDGTQTYVQTDDYNQTVNPSQVVACGGISNTTLVTFTTKEEATFNLLNASIEINLQYGGSNISQNEEYNFSDYIENNSNWSICIYPSTGFTYMSGIVSYYKSINASYDRRDYWLNNALFTNETNNITLYLASTASTDIFTFTVKDESDSPVIGAYIYVERWDIGGNNFYTVSILKTDSDGKAFMNLRLNDAWYRYKVVTDGVLRLTEGPYKESTTSRTLRINTGSQVINGQIYEPLSTINGITHSLSFNNVTNTFTFSYTDVSGSTSTGCIWIDQILMAAPNRIYTSCINSASGTLSYPVVGNGTFAAYGVLTLDGNYSNYQSIVDTLQVTIGGLERFAIVGTYGRVITLIAVGTAAMIGVASGSIFLGLLLVIATIFGADLIGLINVTSPSNVIFTLIAILVMIIITAARRRNG
jgi:hypothetical protein